ncbi:MULTISPECIES: hypothetical protein [unclassified Nocardiopsis]|uniref:hypothetical protein n=1 Tax=unclassified Nocardiopsis TaxID=2649073 RepID=UPI003401B539
MALTAAVTLVVAGSLTWVATSATGSSARIGSATGLPSGDPCATVTDQSLSGMDGEVSSWSVSTYSNGCTWRVSLGGEENVYLSLNRSVPLSGGDAALAEERDTENEGVPADSDELFAAAVDRAVKHPFYEETDPSDTWDRPLNFGNESTLVLAHFPDGSGGSQHQAATLVVRDGRLVSTVNFLLTSPEEDMDLNTAEEVLSDVAADIFG